MSFYHLPHPWNPGYALPDYVQAEPPERGVFTTAWLPRGTISAVVPDFLAKPVMGLGDTVYELDPMGATGDEPVKRAVAVYGQNVGSWITETILSVPAAYRKVALRSLLDTLDPSLWGKVAARMERSVAKGMLPKDAMREALAASMSAGMLAELVQAGKRGSVAPDSQLGLGTYGDTRSIAQYQALDRFYELGGFWSSMKDGIKKMFPEAAKSKVKIAGVDVVTAAGPAIGQAADWVTKGVTEVAGAACRAADTIAGAAPAIASAAGPYGGVAAGAITVTKGICGSGPVAPQLPPPPPPSTPGWVLPAAIGGGTLMLALALRK